MFVFHPEIAALWRHYKQVEEDYYRKGRGYNSRAASAQSLTEKERCLRLSSAYYVASWEAGKIALALEDLYFPNSRNALRGRKHPMSRSAYKHIEKIFARSDVQVWLQNINRQHTFTHVMWVIHSIRVDYNLTTEDLEDGEKTLTAALDLTLEELYVREKQLREEMPFDPDQRYPYLLQLLVYTLIREQKEFYVW